MGNISKNWSHSYKRKIGDFCTWPAQVRGLDLGLLLCVGALVVLGLLMVYSSSFIYAHERSGDGFLFIRKQAAFAVLGMVGLWVGSWIDYRRWKVWSYFLLGLSTLLLAAVFVPGFGVKMGGAQRWLNLGLFSFQPAELVKVAILLVVAAQLARKQDRLSNFTAGIVSNFLVAMPALVFLIFQPDFGTTVIVGAVMLILMFLAGVRLMHLFGALAVLGSAAFALIVYSPYRLARFLSFLNPWDDPSGKGFQILQSLVGFLNGRFSGVGLGNGKQKLFYLPEAHNDFIFSVVGEELGFIGVAAIVFLFSFFVYRGLRIGWQAFKKHDDRFGLYLACGITLILGLQAFVNMAVVLGLLPTKGLTLPFISYGGSALAINLFAVGLLLSVSRGPREIIGKFKN